MSKYLFKSIFINGRINPKSEKARQYRRDGIKRPHLTCVLSLEDHEFEELEKMDAGLKEKFDNIEKSHQELIDYVQSRIDPHAVYKK